MAPPKSKSTKKASETGTERLDVEGDDARQKRLQSLLEHLSTPTSNPATTTLAFPAPLTGLPKFNFGDRRTEEVVPNIELLSRVQAFLPQLEASNRELLARAKVDPKSVDIENVETKDGRVIEMNLGLGVFESKEPQGRKSGKAGKKDTTNALSGDAPPSTKRGSDKDDEEMDSSSLSSSFSSDDSDSDSSSTSSSSTSSSSSSSQAEDQGPNDPLTDFFASLGSALDSATSSSSPHSDPDSDSGGDEEEDGDGEGPLTTFFDSLRYGQTISMDSSDEDEDEGGEEGDVDGESIDSDSSGELGEKGRKEGRREETREVKPLPKRTRPRIEVVGDEAPVDDVKRGAGEV